jgi:RNA polymerase-binding transcription factor DksA
VDSHGARERLEAEQGRVEGLIQELRSELGTSETEGSSELADYDQHPADTASDTFEREKDLSILEQLENELAELQAALERVDAGTYGIDEETGEPIDDARLDAFPTARTNVRAADLRARDTRQEEIPEGPR